jgi:DNA-binding XRE family transcriptional regulator
VAKRLKSTSDAVEILHRRVYAGRPERLKRLDEARANEEIARKIHTLRVAAGFTQTQLAKLIGTTASVICRLEDADYEGHSLAMLRRIGAALHQRVEIRFVPLRRSALRDPRLAIIRERGLDGAPPIKRS